MRWMLDTDTVSFALRGHGRVAEHLLEARPSDVCMSALTLAELRYGADLKRSRRLHTLIDAFAADVTVLAFDEHAARAFGRVAANLASAGTPIGTIDVLIAAHALASDAVLVTNNSKHFGRVPGLSLENWV